MCTIYIHKFILNILFFDVSFYIMSSLLYYNHDLFTLFCDQNCVTLFYFKRRILIKNDKRTNFNEKIILYFL